MTTESIWTLHQGDGPLVGLALHDGHDVRPEVRALLALAGGVRRREEDPYTGAWTDLGGTQIIATRSRFEVDLNRPREKAVYLEPDDAWGLKVWQSTLPRGAARHSLAEYDAFYSMAHRVCTELVARYGHFVVYDIHTYNHRREGPEGTPADPADNPEVNIGTGTLDRSLWGPVVDRFMDDLRGFDFMGRHLDVRENIKFQGGGFSRFVHTNFPGTGCALAIEFKKFFMDEWTGECYSDVHAAIHQALCSTVPGVLDALAQVRPKHEQT